MKGHTHHAVMELKAFSRSEEKLQNKKEEESDIWMMGGGEKWDACGVCERHFLYLSEGLHHYGRWSSDMASALFDHWLTGRKHSAVLGAGVGV